MVVLDQVRALPEAGRSGDGLIADVDGFDIPHVHVRPAEEPAQGADDIGEADGPRDHLRQHRLEHEVVLAAKERYRPVFETATLPFQGPSGVYAPKTPAHDHDPFHDAFFPLICGPWVNRRLRRATPPRRVVEF